MANHNIQRLSEDVKREIAAALPELKDSRVASGLVTITHCEITSDMSYCKVYISCLNGEESTAKAVDCLKSAQGFFKRRINARIKMRKIPELIFMPDNSLDYYDKISKLIDELPPPNTNGENADED